jgi:hypothetical protein
MLQGSQKEKHRTPKRAGGTVKNLGGTVKDLLAIG